MDLKLKNKVVLVTGGSQGLGLASARSLLAEGARVALVARHAGRLAQAVAQLAEEGWKDVKAFAADLGTPQEAERVVAEVEQALGPIDVLINSAGAARRRAPSELDAAAWSEAISAKFLPYIHAQDAVLRRFGERARAAGQTGETAPQREIGAIVNIVGTGGKVPSEPHIAGGAANAALLLATIGLAQYHARFGIRINAVNPGVTETGRIAQTLQSQAQRLGVSVAQARALGESALPLRRYGQAAEVADVVAFVASERASYMVGALVSVDGGQKSVL
ncbi:SDR family NAD(P)-dependent oxidoreductase [Acidovorax sp. CCYZU-2555]|uniref:SDR family NAD(P)-dependent oxidoreductase n=1 Tax=Acidovorax sp. CCYZU-2555 TaxID=2835042 RepID=UPI001BCE39D7|nr:SDR family NAD(P)-dependent oxidoreductase [Acidovorax sp. CCYZU-2555]MBS7780528.1 SDR family NAD(P)-dependent oxidoreductase [Acidovorax sp. CCYZU-2555]